MQVHVEEAVEGTERAGEGVTEDQDEQESQTAHIVENLARVYGFALLLLLFSIIFVLALCVPEYTVWPTDGVPSRPSMLVTNRTKTSVVPTVPTVNKSTWSMFLGVLIPSLIALRTTLAESCGDPHPLPGRQSSSWKYAPQ